MDQGEIYAALGRLRASRRRTMSGTCAVCGTPFEGSARRQYCGHNCAATAWRRRRAQHQPTIPPLCPRDVITTPPELWSEQELPPLGSLSEPLILSTLERFGQVLASRPEATADGICFTVCIKRPRDAHERTELIAQLRKLGFDVTQ